MTPGAITLYDYWRSSASYRVRIALNLKNLPYRSVAVDLAEKEHLGRAHKDRNPLGRVPVLTINGLTLTQSFAMLEYLEEVFPEPPLLPADAAARAWVRALALIVVADIHPIGNPGTMAHAATLLPGGKLDSSAWQRHFIGQGLRAFEALLAQDLARGPAGQFCHGDAPGLADCCLIPQLYNARRWGAPLDDYPRIRAVEAAALAVEGFQKAHPDAVKK